jgi:NADH-quinone oxidoreductase subunit G
MADLVKITIDDRTLEVPKGANVLDSALKAGIDISYFCYHPGLSVAACCRQCLVEVAGNPKLQPSCQMTATDGLKMVSSSERVLTARQQMLEFTLVNHPVDCPICDKAGECSLQKMYFEWDAKPSRQVLTKIHKPKRVDLGPTIVLDQERCILCTRCIRVCDEVAGQHQLEMAHRGDREVLTTAPGKVLDNPYSLNTVDVCPVGALTAKDFRFTMRAWELYSTSSVCTGCATGCNIEIHHKDNRIYRLVPRENQDVNKFWMCDEGRMTYKDVHEGRLIAPLVDGLPSSWDKALNAAVTRLQGVLDGDRKAFGVVLAAGHGNEENYLLARLAREFLGVERVYAVGKAPVPARADKILRDADVNPNSAGVVAIGGPKLLGMAALEKDLVAGALRGLIVLGSDAPLAEAALAKAEALDALVVVAAHERGLAARAHVALACAAWPEAHGTMTNRQGRVQRLRAAYPVPGQALPAWEVIVRLARKLGATFEYAHPKTVFAEMKQAVPAFASAQWGGEEQTVQLRFAASRG